VNAFIPALIAVFLAECGGRAALFLVMPKLVLAALLLGLSIGVSAFAGITLAPTMNVHARALLLGIALILTGCAQFGKAPSGAPPASVIGTLLFVWRSSAPFLAFAFAIWKSGAVGASAGSLAGLAGAVAFGVVPLSSVQIVWVRRASGATLGVVGIYATLWALRLTA
jgi:hypothetical protein